MSRTLPVLLWPQEHGTYGEIAFPLMAALMIGNPSWMASGVAVMALGGYLAHEGLVVLLGRRGGRARCERARPAWRSVVFFGGIAGMGAMFAAAGGLPADAWQGLGLAGGLSGFAIAATWLGRERTLGGEALAAVALAAWSAPTALAAGVRWDVALTIWTVWSVAFVVATCAVHVVIARSTRRARSWALAGGVTLSMAGPAAALLLARSATVPRSAVLILLPSCLAALVVLAAPVSARRLRDIGWSLMVIYVVTLGLMVGFLR